MVKECGCDKKSIKPSRVKAAGISIIKKESDDGLLNRVGKKMNECEKRLTRSD